jgi:hypothetical protein
MQPLHTQCSHKYRLMHAHTQHVCNVSWTPVLQPSMHMHSDSGAMQLSCLRDMLTPALCHQTYAKIVIVPAPMRHSRACREATKCCKQSSLCFRAALVTDMRCVRHTHAGLYHCKETHTPAYCCTRKTCCPVANNHQRNITAVMPGAPACEATSLDKTHTAALRGACWFPAMCETMHHATQETDPTAVTTGLSPECDAPQSMQPGAHTGATAAASAYEVPQSQRRT